MAQPPEDRKPDFSGLPRAAIGMKGLPISRNTRLPSIRSPRDLTLGAMPKKTYMPNIPVRREKKSSSSGNASSPKQENKLEKRQNISPANERGRGRGRGRQIIQTQGAIFAEGIAQNSLSRKEKVREAYQKSDYMVPRGPSIKREKDEEVAGVSKALDNLLRDDFIDDGDDDDVIVIKPIIFPATSELKKETKTEVAEPAANFNPNIAKEMGFDVNQVAKFIKKEKNTDTVEKPEMEVDKPAASSDETKLTSDNIEVNDIKKLLNGGVQ